MPRRENRTQSLSYLDIYNLHILIFLLLLTSSQADDFFDDIPHEVNVDEVPVFSGLPQEQVDPFTGQLKLVHHDLVLPGKGGLDLVVTRTYENWWHENEPRFVDVGFPEGPVGIIYPPMFSPLGPGWSLHMGILRLPPEEAPGGEPCPTYHYLAPDGKVTSFVPSSPAQSQYVSERFDTLVLNCGPGACLYTNDGLRLEFDASLAFCSWDASPENSFWPLTRITDPHGNTIQVAYAGSGVKIQQITDTYGRQVTFEDEANGTHMHMRVNGQLYLTYEKNHIIPVHVFSQARLLTAVISADGPAWHYEHNGGFFQLSKMTTPSGGVVAYQYASSPYFNGLWEYDRLVVRSRTTGGREIVPGQWTFDYDSREATSVSGTTTTVTRPDQRQDRYRYFGFAAVPPETGFKYGLPIERVRGMDALHPQGLERTTYSWGYQSVGWLPSCRQSTPVDTKAPHMTDKTVVRDGLIHERRYQDFDAYNQPQTIVSETYATAAQKGQRVKIVSQRFWSHIDAVAGGYDARFLVGFPEAESTCIGEDCRYSANSYFAEHGKVRSENRSGVTTTYAYHADGNLLRQVDAKGSYVEFHHYDRGVAKTLDLSGLYTISRVPDLFGRVTQETIGDRTSRWDYDQLGRLKVYTPPTGAPTTYIYAPDNTWRQGTRLHQVSTTHVDGFGRPILVVDPVGVNLRMAYDAFGRERFRSYPYEGSPLDPPGDTMAYDGLDRLISLLHAPSQPGEAATERRYGFDAEGRLARVTITNERQATTVQLWESFGEVDDRRMAALRNADGERWTYTYNVYNSLVGIDGPGTAGDYDYDYDSRNFLIEEVHPAKGITQFGRDAVGNLTWRIDSRDSLLTRFNYDALHRIDFTDYPDSTPDIDHDYVLDRLHQITRTDPSGALVTRQTLNYEPGGNRLASQRLDIGPQSFTTSYRYNALDCLKLITYPTATTPIEYFCDAANRTIAVRAGDRMLIPNIDYHPSGHLAGMTYNDISGTIHTTRTYDMRQRLDTLSVIRLGEPCPPPCDEATTQGTLGPVFVDRAYLWDGVGNLTTQTDNGVSYTRDYDLLNRLELATGPWGTRRYTYDALGHRLTLNDNGTVTRSHHSGVYLQSTSGGTPRSFGYDLVGNRTHGSAATYHWDRSNRMTEAIVSGRHETYTYDGGLLRVRKQSAAQDLVSLYGLGGRLLGAINADGSDLRRYVYVGGQVVAEVPLAPSLRAHQ